MVAMWFRGMASVLANIRKYKSTAECLGMPPTTYPRSSIGPNQVCTLLGAKPGVNTTSGRSYLLNGYDMDDRDIWRRNFVVLLCWMLFYQVTQILILDFLPVSVSHESRCSSFQLTPRSNAPEERFHVCSLGRRQRRTD